MKLLLDANLSPRIVDMLGEAGVHAEHVRDVGLIRARDSAIFDFAVEHGYIVVTADSDFAMLLALRRSSSPSVILMRGVSEMDPTEHAQLLVSSLPTIAVDLDRGAIVSLGRTRARIRDLPLA